MPNYYDCYHDGFQQALHDYEHPNEKRCTSSQEILQVAVEQANHYTEVSGLQLLFPLDDYIRGYRAGYTAKALANNIRLTGQLVLYPVHYPDIIRSLALNDAFTFACRGVKEPSVEGFLYTKIEQFTALRQHRIHLDRSSDCIFLTDALEIFLDIYAQQLRKSWDSNSSHSLCRSSSVAENRDHSTQRKRLYPELTITNA